jgi:hypothetical protein
LSELTVQGNGVLRNLFEKKVGLADFDAELEQLSVNPRCTPKGSIPIRRVGPLGAPSENIE